MLHSNLQNQIAFIREEIKDEFLSTIERAQLKQKLSVLVERYNTLARKANAFNWHVH